MRPTRTCVGALVAALAGACSSPPAPTPPPAPLVVDPSQLSPTDAWSAEFTFRDTTARSPRRPTPPNGWLLTPLHGHLLPTGRVLLHGSEKETSAVTQEDPYVLFNDASWVLDPADPRLASPTDADLPFDLTFPATRSAADPDGLIRSDSLTLHEVGENLQCGGHTFLADGVLFYSGGTAFVTDDDPAAPPEPDSGGLISVGASRSALYNAAPSAVGGAAPGWSSAPPHALGPRYYPTATRLADGRVVLSSGYFDTQELPNPSVEVYSPSDRRWSTLVPGVARGAALAEGDPRRFLFPDAEDYVHAFALPTPWPAGVPADNALPRQVALIGVTGQVHLLATDGGTGIDRLYLPPNGRRPGEETGPAAVSAKRHEGATSVLLPDGRIMIAGGASRGGYGGRADIYDPRPGAPGFGTWERLDLCDASGQCISRHSASSLFLPDGRVMLIAGREFVGHDEHEMPSNVPARPTEDDRRPIYVAWDRRAVTFGAPWPENRIRGQHNLALLLPDGRVLLVGGRVYACEPACLDEQSNMRLYSPPYLDPVLAPLRPRITAVVDAAAGAALAVANGLPVVARGSRLRVDVASPAQNASAMPLRFALVALGSVTHRFDMNLRYVPVASSRAPAADRATLEVPADAAALIPGPYMLFAVRTVATRGGDVDVPSPARIVMVR